MIINKHLNQLSSESQKTACQGSSSIRSCANSWASHSNISSPAMAPISQGFADLTNKFSRKRSVVAMPSPIKGSKSCIMIIMITWQNDQVKDDVTIRSWKYVTLQLWLNLQTCADCCKHVWLNLSEMFNIQLHHQWKGKETYGSWLNHQSQKVRATIEYFPLSSIINIFDCFTIPVIILTRCKQTKNPKPNTIWANVWLAVFNHGGPALASNKPAQVRISSAKGTSECFKSTSPWSPWKHPEFFPATKFGFGKKISRRVLNDIVYLHLDPFLPPILLENKKHHDRNTQVQLGETAGTP